MIGGRHNSDNSHGLTRFKLFSLVTNSRRSVLSRNAWKRIQLAEQLTDAQDWHQAASAWQAVLTRNSPETLPPVVWVKAGRTQRHLSRFDAAEDVLSIGMGVHPHSLPIQKEFAEVAVDRCKWREAARRWQTVVDTVDNQDVPSDVWLKLGVAHKNRRALKQADSAIQHGLSHYPDDFELKVESAEVASRRQRWEEATRRWQVVIEAMDAAHVPAGMWVRQGRAYRNRHLLDSAQSVIEKGLHHNPEDPHLHNELAEIAASRGDWPEAVSGWQAVIDNMEAVHVPASVWVKLGRAHQKLCQFDAAAEVLRKGLEYHPDYPDLLTEMAETATLREDWPEAAKQWREAINSRGDTVPGGVWARLIQALRNEANATHQELDSLADHALEVSPSSYDVLVERARAASERRDWAKAAEWWWEVAQAYPGRSPASVWNRLSQALRYSHKPEKAEHVVRSVIDTYPDEVDLQRELAETYIDQRKWSAAEEVLEHIFGNVDRTDLLRYEKLGRERMMYSALQRLNNLDAYRHQLSSYQRARSENPPSIVIYTAISGNYDSLKLPATLDPRFDFVVFTDTPIADTGIFDVRPMPHWHEDETRAARHVKTHPHLLLSDYEIAVWIDANIMIMDDIYPMVEAFLRSEHPVAAVPHSLRGSVTEEAEECIQRSKDSPSVIRQQLARYKKTDLTKAGLIESNFMMFDLTDETVHRMCDVWWSEINAYSRRDQLSLNYALRQTGLEYHALTQPPDSIRNHPRFAYTPHVLDNKPVEELIECISEPPRDPFHDLSYTAVKDERLAGQNLTIDIIVCVHNALESVRACLESVAAHRKQTQRLIIVDDGSETETAGYLDEFTQRHEEWTMLLRNTHAGGYSRAANRGLKEADGDLAILLNSDVVVTEYWAEKMADVARATPKAGVIGPMSSAASYQSIPQHRRTVAHQTATNDLPEGVSPGDVNRKCEEWSRAGIFPTVPLVHGSCFGITKEAREVVGIFDEARFPRGYGEETDYCFRAVDAGFQLVIATNTYVFHAKSQSYSDTERQQLTRNGSDKLKHTYGEKRFYRAVRTMDFHPILEDMRRQSKSWYRDMLKNSGKSA